MNKLHFHSDIMPIGWQECVALPGLSIPIIKAKIDTGAKTSALHAAHIQEYNHGHQKWVKFEVHPIQGNPIFTIHCRAKVIDERIVVNSGGQRELRYVIKTPMTLGNTSWEIELTLTERHGMAFRMLLGREALQHRVAINPALACLQGKFSKNKIRKIYGLNIVK